MKKLIFVIATILLTFSLASCKNTATPEYPIDLTISIAEETIDDDSIEVHLLIPSVLNDMDELIEITMNAASQTYEKHFDTIGTDSYMMTIYLYGSIDDYNNDIETYGHYVFDINKNLETPGLSLRTNGLILE